MSKYRKDCIAFAAPSGGGKTTFCRMLLEKYPDLVLSISFTTRPPRGEEKDGVDYHFVSKAGFEKLIQEKDLIEWAEVHGNYYGTSKKFMDAQIAKRKIVLLDVDVQGVNSFKSAYGNRCLSIFLLPPSIPELENRLRSRKTDSEEKIQERMKNALSEMTHSHTFDVEIVNTNLETTFQEICAILKKEVGLAN